MAFSLKRNIGRKKDDACTMKCKLCGCPIKKTDATKTIGKTTVHWMCNERRLDKK